MVIMILFVISAIALSLQEEKAPTTKASTTSLYPSFNNIGGGATSSPTNQSREPRKVRYPHPPTRVENSAQ